MDGVTVKGRGMRQPATTVVAEVDGIDIRIDPENLPEFWCELHISADALVELLQQVLAVRGGTIQTYNLTLDVLRVALRK